MDSDGYRNDFHYTETESVWQHVTPAVDQRSRDADGWKLVEVFLSGGAPWGFTLRGGLEHREPLLITKVEDGSKAASVCLQVGDELVNINEIALSGYRQEAICLVKGSHKTLSVVVKRNMNMVDIVAQKMPSENDVHVARSFLTKILRSSMRRNEPISRPHSWHATKFNENQSEAAKTQSPPPPVWHNTYDASSSSSADLSSGWEQTNLRRVSDQFSSLGSMDSLEHVPNPYAAGRLSPAKSNNSMEHLSGGKRDSAYSSFSTSSGTPDYTLSKSNDAASAENVLYKVSQWDSGGKASSRSSHGAAEGGQPDDRLTYFQMPGVGAGSDTPQTEDPAGSRQSSSSRSNFGPVWHVPEKKKISPSPPPPPARRDSFAATKVHERGLVITEEPESQSSAKAGTENRRNHNLPLKNDANGFSNRPPSMPSSGALQSQPHHQRHADKSTFYSQPWPTSKPQSTSGYQCGPQEAPAHQRRSMSTAAAEQNGDSRYYCVTTCQPAHTNPAPKPEERRSFSGEHQSVSPPTTGKAKYPQQHSKDSNGYQRPETSDDRGHQRGHPSEHRRSLPLQPRDLPQDVRQISAQTTPMLHSLSLDAAEPREKLRCSASEESADNRQMKRNERFATTLRNEIQMRKARLQKSKSAATLPCAEDEAEEDQDQVWKSTPMSPDSSFTNIYKDHLKEAQARVLKATSFRRKDLEPVLAENSAAETLASYPSSVLGRRDVTALPTLSESATTKSGPAVAPLSRIGGRKRFPTEKKVRSFSEPDKINQVGVSCHENTNSASLEQQTLSPRESSHSSSQSYEDQHSQDRASIAATGGAVRGLSYSTDKQQSVLDQQRLGTFAEYEARWNPQKKAVETRASGHYRSADDILETRPEDRKTTSYVHERSRSSPSADIYGQTFPVASRSSEGEPAELLRFSDCKDREKQAEFECLSALPTDSAPATAPAAAVAAENHTLMSASHSLTRPEEPPPTPRKKPLPLRCLDIDSASTHGSSSTEHSSAFSPTHPVKADSEQGKGHGAAPHHPASSSSSSSSSHRRSGPSSMEEQRSPSPHFSPQKLSDRPPVSLQDQDTNRTDHAVIESPNSAVKKVPIRIVHSEGVAVKDNYLFPRHSDLAAPEVEPPGGNRLNSLTAVRQDSVFCAFTRQRESADAVPAAQTDEMLHRDTDMSSCPPPPPLTDKASSCRITEDQKREELFRDIMGKDKSLADVLDQRKMKTTMDLMEGIFPEGEHLLEEAQQRRKPSASRPPEEREKEESVAAAGAVVTSSAYYSTSAPKAELLIKMKDMQETEDDSEDELDMDLSNKKQELIDSLSRKLQVLREARQSLQEDVLDNNALGDEVEVQVQQVCKPNELDKFRMFVGDLDKVVSLLLSLSGRLARVENALNSLEEDATLEERRTLTEKRKLLIRQHEDAKELKENLDRRERVVYDILATHLDHESLADYEHFVKMKSALIIEQRKLEDRVKLGEEQLKCLLDSLSIEQRLVF